MLDARIEEIHIRIIKANSARQMGIFGPGTFIKLKKGFQFFQSFLGQMPKGSDFTTIYAEKRCILFYIQLKHIIPGGL